jgi:hypothetical protein
MPVDQPIFLTGCQSQCSFQIQHFRKPKLAHINVIDALERTACDEFSRFASSFLEFLRERPDTQLEFRQAVRTHPALNSGAKYEYDEAGVPHGHCSIRNRRAGDRDVQSKLGTADICQRWAN